MSLLAAEEPRVLVRVLYRGNKEVVAKQNFAHMEDFMRWVSCFTPATISTYHFMVTRNDVEKEYFNWSNQNG